MQHVLLLSEYYNNVIMVKSKELTNSEKLTKRKRILYFWLHKNFQHESRNCVNAHKIWLYYNQNCECEEHKIALRSFYAVLKEVILDKQKAGWGISLEKKSEGYIINNISFHQCAPKSEE